MTVDLDPVFVTAASTPSLEELGAALARLIDHVEASRAQLVDVVGEAELIRGLAVLRQEHQAALYEAAHDQPEDQRRRALAAALDRLATDDNLLVRGLQPGQRLAARGAMP